MYLINKTSSPCAITTYLPCWWPSGSPPFCRCTGNRKWWLRSQLPCCKWCPFLNLTPKTCTSNHCIYTCTLYSKIILMPIFARYVVTSQDYSSKNYWKGVVCQFVIFVQVSKHLINFFEW